MVLDQVLETEEMSGVTTEEMDCITWDMTAEVKKRESGQEELKAVGKQSQTKGLEVIQRFSSFDSICCGRDCYAHLGSLDFILL